MVRLGLVDSKNLSIRSEKCLTCHLGAPGLQVDHELIAAGHPDLRFELDSYTRPSRRTGWRRTRTRCSACGRGALGRRCRCARACCAWLALPRAGPGRVQRDGLHYLPPRVDRARELAAEGRICGPSAGDAPYNVSRYVAFRKFAEEVDPSTNHELQAETDKVAHLITTMSPDRGSGHCRGKTGCELIGQAAGRDARCFLRSRANTAADQEHRGRGRLHLATRRTSGGTGDHDGWTRSISLRSRPEPESGDAFRNRRSTDTVEGILQRITRQCSQHR